MKLWKFCKGYVNIGIMGKYPERLVNRCISEGISLSNCERAEKGLYADIPARDLYKLRRIRSGCGCSIRIRRKRGLPQIVAAARRSTVFLVSLAAFLLVLLALSTRIWFISISSEVVPPAEIEKMLLDMGVKRGASKRTAPGTVIASVLNADSRIANAKVKIRGVKLTVRITDALAPMETEKEDAPADLVADRDCVISYISVLRGHAEVKPGQAVKKGDILIRGELSSVKEGYAVRAEGVVLGRVLYMATAAASSVKTSLKRSGRSETVAIVTVLGQTISLPSPYEEYELTPIKEGLITASPLPVRIARYEAFELIESTVKDTPEGTKERARLMAQEKLSRLIPEGAKIVSVSTECTNENDGSVTATITVTTVEKIGTHRGF